MLYTSRNKNFKHHVSPQLQRRMRIFLIIAFCMLVIAVTHVAQDNLNPYVVLGSVIGGAVVGVVTTRIFHLSWDHDGQKVVGRIDKIGLAVLVLYVLFEIARSMLFEKLMPAEASSALSQASIAGFIFIAAALISRVVALRGRMINILREQKIFG
ncbi:MAG TPA: hypothetical protein VHA78_06010 [Candidatus Peribacteraceae bacterium]|nr:hypothetical protein [Candidatus Peribacteraceae bacterium]